jgi:hypothetical protein
VPWAIAHASYKQQEDNEGATEIVEIKNRGHALTIDSDWREVPRLFAFVKGFVQPSGLWPVARLGAARHRWPIDGAMPRLFLEWWRNGRFPSGRTRTEARTLPATSNKAQTHMGAR